MAADESAKAAVRRRSGSRPSGDSGTIETAEVSLLSLLDEAKQTAGIVGKVADWVRTLSDEERDAFLSAAKDPSIQTQRLLVIGEAYGLDSSHTGMRRFREALNKGKTI